MHASRTRKFLVPLLACIAGIAGCLFWNTDPVVMWRYSRASVFALEQQVAANPNDWRTQYWFGKRSAEAGDLVRAEPALRAAVGTTPDFLPAATELGKLLFAQGRIEEAFQVLSMVVGRDPGQRDARLALAVLYRTQGAYPRAAEMLTELLRTEPKHVAALYELGVAQFSMQKVADAEASFRSALRHDPANLMGLTALSRLRRMQGALEEAEDLGRRAVARDPTDLLAHVELARAVAEQEPAAEHRREALQILESVRPLYPGHPTLTMDAARLLVAEQRWREAVATLNALVRISPRTTQAYFLLARSLRALGQDGEAQRAEATFRRLQTYDVRLQELASRLGADPDSSDLRYQIGELHASIEAWPEAIGAYRNGLQRDPQNRAARNRLAALIRRNLDRANADDPAR